MKRKDGFKGERSIVLPQAVIRLIEDDPVASSIFITDIGYYPKARYHYRKREPPIREYVFIYCVDGKGWYVVGGRRYAVKQGQYFILPAEVVHEYGADEDDPWSIYWIHFRGTLARFYAGGCLTPADIKPGINSRINARISLFEEIFNTLNTSYAIENIRYAMATFQHYLASLRYIQQYRGAAVTPDSSDLVGMAIHFLEENVERRLTINEICGFVGLSPSRLSTIFKERTGYSPLNYFLLLKMKRACAFLDDTEMKITQISAKLGFDDQFYFSRLFSRMMGMSPRTYRHRSKT